MLGLPWPSHLMLPDGSSGHLAVVQELAGQPSQRRRLNAHSGAQRRCDACTCLQILASSAAAPEHPLMCVCRHAHLKKPDASPLLMLRGPEGWPDGRARGLTAVAHTRCRHRVWGMARAEPLIHGRQVHAAPLTDACSADTARSSRGALQGLLTAIAPKVGRRIWRGEPQESKAMRADLVIAQDPRGEAAHDQPGR